MSSTSLHGFGSAEVAAAQPAPKALFYPAANRSPATACVVFLHGSGGDGLEFAELFDRSVRAALPHVSWLFPSAAPRPYSLFGGVELPVWFDRDSLELDCREDRAGIAHSVAAVRALLAEYAEDLPPSRIIVGGFSQGGGLALYTAFAHGADGTAAAVADLEPFAGCVTCGAFLPDPTFLLKEPKQLPPAGAAEAPTAAAAGAFPAALRRTPLLLVHGTRDPVVPYGSARSTFERLRDCSGLAQV